MGDVEPACWPSPGLPDTPICEVQPRPCTAKGRRWFGNQQESGCPAITSCSESGSEAGGERATLAQERVGKAHTGSQAPQHSLSNPFPHVWLWKAPFLEYKHILQRWW